MNLDVPFVEQSSELCGGAAAAMVLRYQGASNIHAGDFAALLDPGAGGIYANRLVTAIRRHGYIVHQITAGEAALDRMESDWLPLLVLLSTSPERFHYVVVVGVQEDMVIIHDPAVGPDRRIRREDFLSRWRASGCWAICVTRGPPRERAPAVNPPNATAPAARSRLDDRVDAAVERARRGAIDEAADSLARMCDSHPDAARPWQELAGIEFKRRRWRAAAAAAQNACDRDPNDAYSCWLLGASLHLAGNDEAALDAWNRIERPRIDIVQAPGNRRTRHDVLTTMSGLRPGAMLTRKALRLADRRIRSVPAVAAGHVSYQLQGDASADVRLNVVERSNGLLRHSATVALRATTQREIEIPLASVTGNGEMWAVSGRFWENRPRLRLEMRTPAAFGWPTVTSLSAAWSRQTYRLSTPTRSTVTESHRWARAAMAHWLTADVLVTAQLSGHRLNDATYGGIGLSGERRWAGDTIAARVAGLLWSNGHAGYVANAVQLASKTDLPGGIASLETRAGNYLVDADAPGTLRSGVGAGHAGVGLLRAHPLVGDDGAIDGAGFSSAVTYAGVDATCWLPGPIPATRLGVALFADGARVWGDAGHSILVDAGVGTRLGLPASLGMLSVDLATGLRDRAFAISLRWTRSWPTWSFDT